MRGSIIANQKNKKRGFTLFETVIAIAVSLSLLIVVGTAILSAVNERNRAVRAYEVSKELSSMRACIYEWLTEAELAAEGVSINAYTESDKRGLAAQSSEGQNLLFFDSNTKSLMANDETLALFDGVYDMAFAVCDGRAVKVVAFYGQNNRSVFFYALGEV